MKMTTFTGLFTKTLLAAGTDTAYCYIPIMTSGRGFLRRVYWDWWARDTVAGTLFNKYSPGKTDIKVWLYPDALAGGQLANGSPTLLEDTGFSVKDPASIVLPQPGQFEFENLSSPARIRVNSPMTNNNANSIDLTYMVICDVEMVW